ncbi:cornifelin homolog [Dreissena polymorpha]|uniref:cornifelin homolog n=1 Tax=Dreissena polymorpha TaxID=45954 RepID=UPI00226509A9|nr:cornifelin homolog [Dreissena polymorpha]
MATPKTNQPTAQPFQLHAQHLQPPAQYGQPITGQPGSMLVGTVKGHRDWNSGAFGCCDDVKLCFLTWFCYSCMVCQISKKLGDCPLMPFCVPGSEVVMRARVRTLGGIRGTVCNDCLTTTFCPFCTVCQMKREMDAMGI